MRAAELVFALAFLVAGLGASALAWTRDTAHYGVYAERAGILERSWALGGRERVLEPARVLAIDVALRASVLCGCGDGFEPSVDGQPFFDAEESSHLRDVGDVYAWLQPITVLATLVLAVAGLRIGPRRIRRALLVLAASVVGVGLLALAAFEPFFLLFHDVFFPQGNFLFDPRTQNITRLYPLEYWMALTAALVLTFVAVALAVAALVGVRLRSAAR